MSTKETLPTEQTLYGLPVLPLRDVVVYPNMVLPLFVGRKKSVAALEAAMLRDKQVFLVAQRQAEEEDPKAEQFYDVGVIATILQLLKLPDGTIKVLVEGGQRAAVTEYLQETPFIEAEVEVIPAAEGENKEVEGLMRSLLSQFEQYVKLNKKLPSELLTALSSIDDPTRLVDMIAAHLAVKLDEKQKVLELMDLPKRYEKVMLLIESEIDLLQVEKRIRGRVKKQMEKTQREYYLNEQMKAIQKELGDLDDVPNDLEALEKKIHSVGMTKEAKEKALSEFRKLRQMSPASAEATVSRNYIDWMLAVPWKKHSRISKDLNAAEKILEAEHYGLEKVKERILEYLAVQQRVRKIKGPILCLVGPPGVGKTSLGESIAKATNRKFVRMSLGGVRDEAEIRGHRRTYIGALPGRILQKLSKVKVRNPLFLLDEIDKMAMDFRGDPAAALLEVLDPEQNHTFNDHYLEVDYDLSDVMFVATANSLDIPPALLDRMEVIRLSGYTEDEKVHIAEQYLVAKQQIQNGLKPGELKVTQEAIRDIIRYYTREAGVRSLEREIAKFCRKVVKEHVHANQTNATTIDAADLEKYLGVRRFRYGLAESYDQVGQVTGLAWTEVGGDLLTIEVAVVPGKGKATYTGKLGDVMQESIQAALTVVRSRSSALGINLDFYEKSDIHVHVPEGATPKDGPSAGIGMCTALVSALSGIPVRADVAMTGEITLRGEVLPIGGLKEKLLAAHRGGIKMVLIPEENQRDLKEIPNNVKEALKIKPVRWIDEVLALALVRQPTPLTTEDKAIAPILVPKSKPARPDEPLTTH